MRIGGGILATVLACVSAFLFAVDPECCHESGLLAGLEPYRDISSRRGRAHMLRSESWDAAVIGSSRVALGFDTDQHELGAGRTANLGLMDTNLWELLRVAEYAVDQAHVGTILLCVDLHCLASSRRKNFDFDRSDFAPESERNPLASFDELEAELLSFSEIERAIQCLENGRRGVWRHGRNGVDLRRLPPGHCYRADTADHILRVYLANPGTYLGFEYGADRLEDLDLFLARAAQARTRVVLVVPPVHALQLECEYQVGLWDDFERMKRELAEIAARRGVPLLDFATHHDYALERMPERTDTESRMRWWFDSSHCTPELGELVMDRVDEVLLGSSAAANGFGVLLTPDMIEAHLRACLEERDRWRAANRGETAWISEVVHSDALLRLLPPSSRG